MAEFILSAFADEAAGGLDGQIAALKRNRVSYIELRGVDGKNVTQLTDGELISLKQKLDAAGIRVSAIGSPLGKISVLEEFQPHLELFRRTVEIAHKLETPYIRLFSFYLPDGADPLSYRNQVLERLGSFLDAADGSGVYCCHENEKGIYGEVPERVLDLHRTLGPRLKCVFDPANYIQSNVEILPAFQLLRPYLTYLHIKDARIETGQVVPAGRGDGRIREILRILSREDGPWILTVEPHLSVFTGYEKLGDHTQLGTKEFVYQNNDDAFDAACRELQGILTKEIG